MARPKRLDQADLARRGQQLLAVGVSIRDAAGQLGVNQATLRHWIKQLPAEPPAEPPAKGDQGSSGVSGDLPTRLRALARDLGEVELRDQAALVLEAVAALAARPADLPTDESPAWDPDVPLVECLRRQYAGAMRMAQRAQAVGNMSAAQKIGRDAAGMANTIARLEARERDDGGGVRVTQADVDERRAAIHAMVSAVNAQPVACSVCGARLRESWAHEIPEAPP